jgi:hypothetical protein
VPEAIHPDHELKCERIPVFKPAMNKWRQKMTLMVTKQRHTIAVGDGSFCIQQFITGCKAGMMRACS